MIFDLFCSSIAPNVFNEVALLSEINSEDSINLNSPPWSMIIVDVEEKVIEELIVNLPSLVM